MDTQAVSVLIVDDSAMMRNLISRIIEGEADLRVAGKAMNGEFALQKIPKLDPDCIILDLEMPVMNGIEFLKARKKEHIDIPVVILSSKAERGAKVTMDALALGASDFILKPTEGGEDSIKSVAVQLVGLVRAYGNKYREEKGKPPAETKKKSSPEEQISPRTAGQTVKTAPPPPVPPRAAPQNLEVIAIGISTGGPNALRSMFAAIDKDIGLPILVVQHMPQGFTAEFAQSLDRICPLTVEEAKDGDILKPGRVLIAPGNRHMRVEKRPLASVVRIIDDPPVNGHRPSVDVLFESVARVFGNRSMAVIMTGMGKDGAQNIGLIHQAGGLTIGQDEKTCVVYGMPKAAFEYGFLSMQVPLPELAKKLSSLAKEYR